MVTAPPPFEQQVTFLYTRDLAETTRFMEDVLGLERVLEQSSCRIWRLRGGAFVGYCEQADAVPPPQDGRHVIITLVTEDVDAWAARLTARGVTLEKPPTRNDTYNIYHCFFRDPTGYLYEIQRFEDPAWPKS